MHRTDGHRIYALHHVMTTNCQDCAAWLAEDDRVLSHSATDRTRPQDALLRAHHLAEATDNPYRPARVRQRRRPNVTTDQG